MPEENIKACPHVKTIRNVQPVSNVCDECVKAGDEWVHLRMCRICGYVGCCDESKNQHATQHFHDTNHAIIKSLEPGEGWNWCYVDEAFFDYDDVAENASPDLKSNKNAKKVIRNYLMIAGLYTLSTSIIWAVNTLFLLDAGLDILQVFIANAVFTGSMAFFEIPTGVLADTRGRRASFLLSVAIVLLGTLGYVAAAEYQGGLMMFCIMSVVLGLGYTFYSGAVEAWLVDALKATYYTGQLDSVFARGSMVSSSAMIIGSLGGGFLGNIDLSIPFLLRAALLFTVFIVAFFTMYDLGFVPHKSTLRNLPKEMKKIAKDSIAFGWNMKSVRFLIIAAFIQSLFMAWGFYAWQPYFLELLKENLTWVAGVIAALIALSTIIGNSIVEFITRFCGKRTTLMLWAAGIQIGAVVGVGLATSFYLAVGLYLIVMMAMGVWGPVRQAFMHKKIPSEQRASVISFDSLISSGGSMVGQVGLGRLAQIESIATGYVVGGFVLVFVLPVIWILRRREDEADLIVGQAGKQGPCAAQGLPSVTAVDSNTPAVELDNEIKAT